jgi:hypothetical protein
MVIVTLRVWTDSAKEEAAIVACQAQSLSIAYFAHHDSVIAEPTDATSSLSSRPLATLLHATHAAVHALDMSQQRIMADLNDLQVVHIGEPMQIAAPDQQHNQVVPPYHQPQLMTPDQHLNETTWEEIDGPRRGSNSFDAIWSAGASHYHRLLDISIDLRNENARVAVENNNLKIHSINLRADTRARISELEGDLKQAQDRGDEAQSQRMGLKRQLDHRERELGVSAAVIEDLTAQNEALKIQIKDFEAATEDVQRAKQLAAEDMAQLEEQKTNLQEEVKELQNREQTALVNSNRLQSDYDDLTKTKQQLQDACDLAGERHREDLTRMEGEHEDSIHQLNTKHLKNAEKIRSDCEEAHHEQVNLSTLSYAKIMKQKDSDKTAAVKELQQFCDKLRQDTTAALNTLRT